MIGFRALSALALACAASAVACSSSSGSGSGGGTPTKFACATDNTMSTADQSCISCVQSNCGSEYSDAFGSGWASMNFSGGACGSFITCIAGCACDDTACDEKCVGDGGALTTGPCATAETNATNCQTQKCSSQCPTTSPGDDGGGADFDASALANSVCVVESGTTCPTANLSGCCKITAGEACFYAPTFTASDAMQECSAENGTFSTSQ
jgi:hypothetical protein